LIVVSFFIQKLFLEYLHTNQKWCIINTDIRKYEIGGNQMELQIVCPYCQKYDSQEEVELVLCNQCQEELYQMELEQMKNDPDLIEMGITFDKKPSKCNPMYQDCGCDDEEPCLNY
jgi:hypothetical protein